MNRTPPDRLEVARMLREIRMLLDLKKGNRFRARAYEAGARALERTSEDLGKLVRERRLTEIPGIGAGLAATIAEIWESGESNLLRELRRGVEAGAVELSRIRGMTPKRLAAIQAGLGISSVDELKSACERGLVRSLKGFGEKTEQALLEAIRIHEEGSGAALLPHALEVAQALEDHLRRIPECVAVATSGALRRFEELVSEIDVVAAFHDARGACDSVASFPLAARIERQAPDACVLRLADGLRANVAIVSPPQFCAALHRTTGSAQHLRRLAELGAARTPRPRPHAQCANGEAEDCRAEESAIYAKAGLPFIPPELREDAGEIEAGLAGDTFDDLVDVGDIRGMVHCHTTHSDGRNTIEEMARAAEDRGMAYITITDHSPTASYAGGLDLDRLERQWDEIERVRNASRSRILKGTESDILADGSLDYPLDVLAPVRRRDRERPPALQAGRGRDDRPARRRDAAAGVQGVGPRARPPPQAPRPDRVPRRGRARRDRRLARRDRDQRRPAPPRPRAALDPGGPEALDSAS